MTTEPTNPKPWIFRVLLLAGVLAATMVASALIGAPPAHACSLAPTFHIEIADLADGDPVDPLAHLGDAYRAWATDMYGDPIPSHVPSEIPPLIGVWYERSVIAVDPIRTDAASTGGVSIVDSTWGEVPPDLVGPLTISVDNSSCAGQFPLPEPGAFHLVLDTETWVPITLGEPRSETDVAAAREVFDSAFGEPDRPDRDADAEAAALDDVFRRADRDGVLLRRTPRVLDPIDAPASSADDDESDGVDAPASTVDDDNDGDDEQQAPRVFPPGGDEVPPDDGLPIGLFAGLAVALLAVAGSLGLALRNRP